ncbi:DUF4350 domain-containing protein [Plebeiibacterium sediminum]|uniref:DUF4350 domain-containing protein n=1 Tax=Plebeiibacterium sediminum TaxID=2992112 RepID=A0AAE3M1H2_9BACT|nr:DUF4350 domain-containing protein [Plebeiobacterium sediminum]MCW3784974.1 DUF4350 domain-containing protein [Plebeiobacterium sediminum]
MVNNKNKYLLWGIIAGFILYLVILVLNPKPVDWSLSFSKDDDIPYGNKILFNELETVFDSSDIYTCHSPMYNYIDNNRFDEYDDASFIFINTGFTPAEIDFNKLLNCVKHGSNIFIVASSFSKNVTDSLNFKVESKINIYTGKNDSINLNFENSKLKNETGYTYRRAYSKNFFSKIDTARSTILGKIKDTGTNFIKVQYGEGHFFINLNPFVFTNFNVLLDNNYEYVFKSLSYLPRNTKVIWDEYYKGKPRPSSSLVRYILSQKALKYAWYILLFAIASYLIFGAKRVQRRIPIVDPPKNTTLTFIETIGRLYFRKKNHLDLAQKKFNYFLEFLRTKYFINTSVINDDFIKETSVKLDLPEKIIKKLFSQAERLKMNISYTEEDLEQLSRNIEFIYQKCNKSN